jgi:hypothetical protein
MDKEHSEPEHKAKFAKAMEEAWKKACAIYLKASGLDQDSQEWSAILATESAKEVIDIITATWEKRKTEAKGDSQFVGLPSSESKEKSFKSSIKRDANRFIGLKESGRILHLPAAATIDSSQTNIDKRVDLKQKLSGNTSRGEGLIDAGEEGINIVVGAFDSDGLKTIVSQVEKFSGTLQQLANLCAPVIFTLLFASLTIRWHRMCLVHWVAFVCSSR